LLLQFLTVQLFFITLSLFLYTSNSHGRYKGRKAIIIAQVFRLSTRTSQLFITTRSQHLVRFRNRLTCWSNKRNVKRYYHPRHLEISLLIDNIFYNLQTHLHIYKKFLSFIIMHTLNKRHKKKPTKAATFYYNLFIMICYNNNKAVADWFALFSVRQCSDNVFWLILPVVTCLSQRLSHACLSTHCDTVKPRMAH
jgi:hypothetical protein